MFVTITKNFYQCTLPQASVDNLQAAFFVNRLQHVHSKLERATGKVEAKCEMCSDGKAEAFCRHCMMFICAECVKHHQRLRVFAGHKTSSLDELKEGEAREFVTPDPTLQTCKLHDEPMKFFCFGCSCLIYICRDCTIEDHLGHKYQSVKKAAPEVKKKLSQHLEPLREIKDGLVYVKKEVQTTKSKLETRGHALVGQIENSCDQICKIIQNHKKQLVQHVESKISQTTGRLSGQEKRLFTSCAGADSVIEYTQQCMEHLADDEIMCMHAELQSRIDSTIEEQQNKAGNSLEPLEEVDLTVDLKFVEKLKQLCQTITKVPLDPSVVENEVGKTSEITVSLTSLADGKPTKRKSIIECHLKSLVDGSRSKCKVDSVKGHEYRIQYTPTIRGRHELIVTVNKVEVAGSPFPVFASIHPNQLGKPVQVITGLNQPAGIACNSEGNFIICDYHQDVVLMDKKGNKLSSIKNSDYSFSLPNPRGVAVDEDDSIYLVCETTNVIHKINRQMKKLTAQKGESGHDCVAVVGDEVMVCERSKETIKVYSKELEYVREIVSPDQKSGMFASISSDEHGKLYVSDRENSCIVVFNGGGQFLRSFGCDENGIKKINSPWGVCVSGQFVYVSSWDSNDISVFTTLGEYVTSFGKRGRGRGSLTVLLVCVWIKMGFCMFVIVGIKESRCFSL